MPKRSDEAPDWVLPEGTFMTWVLPEPPEDIEGQVEWMAANLPLIREIEGALWHIKRRVSEYVREHGPVGVGGGQRLEIEPSGYEWNAMAVAEIMPALIREAKLSATGSFRDISRALSLVEEELPDVKASLALSVDKTGANRTIKAGGEAGRKLEACRTPKGRLAVV